MQLPDPREGVSDTTRVSVRDAEAEGVLLPLPDAEGEWLRDGGESVRKGVRLEVGAPLPERLKLSETVPGIGGVSVIVEVSEY